MNEEKEVQWLNWQAGYRLKECFIKRMLSLSASSECFRRNIMKAQFDQQSMANIVGSIAKLQSSKDLQQYHAHAVSITWLISD
jgi:hypothetical protein